MKCASSSEFESALFDVLWWGIVNSQININIECEICCVIVHCKSAIGINCTLSAITKVRIACAETLLRNRRSNLSAARDHSLSRTYVKTHFSSYYTIPGFTHRRLPTLVLYFLCTCTKCIKTPLPLGPFGPKWQGTGKNFILLFFETETTEQ